MHRNASKLIETHFLGHWNIVCVWEPSTNLDVFLPTSTCHQTAKFTKKYLGVSTRSNMDMKWSPSLQQWIMMIIQLTISGNITASQPSKIRKQDESDCWNEVLPIAKSYGESSYDVIQQPGTLFSETCHGTGQHRSSGCGATDTPLPKLRCSIQETPWAPAPGWLKARWAPPQWEVAQKNRAARWTKPRTKTRDWEGSLEKYGSRDCSCIWMPIGSMVLLYMVTFTFNIPPMLAYIPYMDPMGCESKMNVGFTCGMYPTDGNDSDWRYATPRCVKGRHLHGRDQHRAHHLLGNRKNHLILIHHAKKFLSFIEHPGQ